MASLPSKWSLPLLGDTLAFALDPAGLLHRRAAVLGPVFEISLFGRPTACFSGAEAFALLLDDENVGRAGANPPHVEKIFNPRAVPFLDGAAQQRRKKLLMHAFHAPALEGYLPAIEQIVARYAKKWATLGEFSWVPELDALGFAVAGTLFVGKDPAEDDPSLGEAFNKIAAGLLSLPINLPFTTFGRALKARDFLLGVVESAISPITRRAARRRRMSLHASSRPAKATRSSRTKSSASSCSISSARTRPSSADSPSSSPCGSAVGPTSRSGRAKRSPRISPPARSRSPP